MVKLTDKATAMLRAALDRPGDPVARGVRLHVAGNEIAAGVAAAPEPGDEVISQDGARLFVGPAAARVLDNKVLDATITTEGKVRLFLGRPESA